jgi:hypothetical protein
MQWSEQPMAVFWQEKLLRPDHSHYFAIFRGSFGAMITSGLSVAEGTWDGIMHPGTGEVVFSRFRHDFRGTKDDTIVVDGGRDYFKVARNKGGIFVKLAVIDGWWRIVEREEPILLEKTHALADAD